MAEENNMINSEEYCQTRQYTQNAKLKATKKQVAKVFSERLKFLKNTVHCTMNEIAMATGIGVPTLTRYLQGDTEPSACTLVHVARAFGVSVDWLIGLGDGNKALVVMNKNVKETIELYQMSTPDDKRLIDTILSKYKVKNNSLFVEEQKDEEQAEEAEEETSEEELDEGNEPISEEETDSNIEE